MKVRLIPPSAKYEAPENARISMMETGNVKVDAIVSNYLNASASALASVGTLTFPAKVADFRRLTSENPWIREIVERTGGARIGLLKRQSGGMIPVGAFEIQAVWEFLDAAQVGEAQKTENAEELEIQI